jgi:hypothetical protein
MASKCPTCQKKLPAVGDNPWRPFCSERCRLVDLGEWMSGGHRIATNEPAPVDEPEPPLTKH